MFRFVVLLFVCFYAVPVFADCLTARVVAASDGDTLTVSYQEARYILRLAGIDAPETSHYGSPAQPFGVEARDYLRQVVGLDVCVEVIDQDKYGRYVVNAWYQDYWINAEMVRAGMAWVYQYYTDSDYLRDLEQAARTNRVGLWTDDNPVYPATFRNSLK